MLTTKLRHTDEATTWCGTRKAIITREYEVGDTDFNSGLIKAKEEGGKPFLKNK